MAILIPDEGEVELLSRLLNKNVNGDLVIKLYTNEYTPVEGSVLGDFTESTGTGYVAITMAGASWTVVTATGTTTGTHIEEIFLYTGAEPNIYGYYVTDLAGTVLLWAEEFTDGPYAVPAGGGQVTITPKIQLD